ncbi:MAG: hypothetical protein WAJ85_12520 [Candidatus Baltobacteraceae bacterium]
MFAIALRAALVIGFLVDAGIALLALFAQPLIAPLLDVPVKDPALTTIYGGALLVLACIYALVLRDAERWQPLLWLCALDQTLSVLLTALEIARGHVLLTVKTVGPMPIQAVLVALFVAGALRERSSRIPRRYTR